MKSKLVTAYVHTLPLDTPYPSLIYLSGNFNNWDPADPQYVFKPDVNGSYTLSFYSDLEYLECKLTRGDWTKAETIANRQTKSNRLLLTKNNENDFWFDVEGWLDSDTKQKGVLKNNVILLNPLFPIPALDRNRKIWVCLPVDYHSGTKKYPVIYMLDGQNLFSQNDTPSWNVDQAIKKIVHSDIRTHAVQQAIIIGIEHGGPHRINEYSAWKNPEHGGGEAPVFLDWLCNELKPFVDSNLRTLKGKKDTTIVGSSMGALFAFYAIAERDDIFGQAGIFSPSLWFSQDIISYVKSKNKVFDSRLLLMAGQQESEDMIGNLLDFYETLIENGWNDEHIHYDLHTDGKHQESFWAKEFEFALEWLMDKKGIVREGVITNESIKFSIIPDRKALCIDLTEDVKWPELRINDYCHNRVFKHKLHSDKNIISYQDWEECLFTIRILSDADLIFSKRVHLNQLAIE